VATRSHIKPESDDGHAFPAVFSVAGRTADQTFQEFGAPSLGFILGARDYPVALEAKLGHKRDWRTVLRFTWHAGRIVHPGNFITYENTPDGLSEDERKDVQVGLEFAQMGAGQTGSGSAKLPTVNELESGN